MLIATRQPAPAAAGVKLLSLISIDVMMNVKPVLKLVSQTVAAASYC